MSKNLENEYRKMIEQEVPDLWNRIESELPDKKTRIYRFGAPYVRMAAVAAAAVVVVCAALPFAGTGKGQTENDRASVNVAGWSRHVERSAAAGDAASTDTPPTEERDELTADRGQETQKEADADFGYDENAQPLSDEFFMEESYGGEESVEVNEEGERAEDDFGEEDTGSGTLTELPDMEHKDVAVSVTGVRTVNGEKIYTVKVLKSTGTGLLKGEELLLKGDDMGEELKEGNEYSVSLVSETSVSAQSVSGNAAEIYSINKIK